MLFYFKDSSLDWLFWCFCVHFKTSTLYHILILSLSFSAAAAAAASSPSWSTTRRPPPAPHPAGASSRRRRARPPRLRCTLRKTTKNTEQLVRSTKRLCSCWAKCSRRQRSEWWLFKETKRIKIFEQVKNISLNKSILSAKCLFPKYKTNIYLLCWN